jgi:hypothetical protein
MKLRTYFLVFSLILISLMLSLFCKNYSQDNNNSDTVYFLIAETKPKHGDSYILPLSNKDHIALADAIINGTHNPQIVSARIVRGSGDGNYLNKDLEGSGKAWSWCVNEFLGFVDVTAEIYDSWPTYVEEHLDEWLQQNNGIIGFWAYTVTRRVDISELQ